MSNIFMDNIILHGWGYLATIIAAFGVALTIGVVLYVRFLRRLKA